MNLLLIYIPAGCTQWQSSQLVTPLFSQNKKPRLAFSLHYFKSLYPARLHFCIRFSQRSAIFHICFWIDSTFGGAVIESEIKMPKSVAWISLHPWILSNQVEILLAINFCILFCIWSIIFCVMQVLYFFFHFILLNESIVPFFLDLHEYPLFSSLKLMKENLYESIEISSDLLTAIPFPTCILDGFHKPFRLIYSEKFHREVIFGFSPVQKFHWCWLIRGSWGGTCYKFCTWQVIQFS